MSSEFYAVSAQVLPVLFLAGAVEFRLLQTTEEQARAAPYWDFVVTNALYIAGFGLTILIGEFAALRSVAEPGALRYADQLIIVSLVASGAVLVLAPLMNTLDTLVRVIKADAQEATEAGTTFTATSSRAETWAFAINFACLLTVLATPVYGVVVAARALL